MPQPDLLLIEDDEAIAELIVGISPAKVFRSARPPTASKRSSSSKNACPDIVLLDWMIEACRGSRCAAACAATRNRRMCRSSC